MYGGHPEAASIGGLFYSKRERQMSLAKFLRFALKAQEARLIHAFTQNQP
jgi:hypothetical protein